jgi:cytochrome c-type biogenesis protein CcmH
MFGFWLLSALLLLSALFVITFTLLKSYDEADENNVEAAELYNQQLNEIELDIENGLLSGNEAKKLKNELQLSLLNQNENGQNSNTKKDSNSSTTTAIILLLLIPLFAISMYQYLGQPGLIEQAALLSEFHNADTQEKKLESVEKMLTQLEQRMINQPDNVDGWLMLTNSYTALERYPEALRAVDNLYRLRGDDPTVMLRYADILAMNNGGVYSGRPTDLINEAMKIDPENPNGLWFAGLAANERGDIVEAVNYWQRLIPKLEEGSEQQQHIKKFIEMISQHVNEHSSMDDYKININVRLSDNLINEVNPDDSVFIYAQAINGPPMPIAVVRKRVSDLPLTTELNDSMAMLPNNKISDHEEVKVTARISKSGKAVAESGDLIGTVNSIKTHLSETINIDISQKVP